MILGVVIVLAAAFIGLLAAVLLSGSSDDEAVTTERPRGDRLLAATDDADADEESDPTTIPPTTTTTTTAVPTSTTTTAPPTTTEPPDEGPGASLRRLADESASEFRQLGGTWVPQLSSKLPGQVIDGQLWDARLIYSNHLGWRSRFEDVLLVRSEEHGALFGEHGYWVTLMNIGFESGEEAIGWCEEQQIPRDDCYAKEIRFDGEKGAAMMQPAP